MFFLPDAGFLRLPKGTFMEQKKTLWIVAAAGIFLLVVVGAALILYSPSLHQGSGIQSGFDPSTGWISSTKQGSTPVPENSISFSSEPASQSEVAAAAPLTPSPFALESKNNNESQKIAQTGENMLHAEKLTVISDNTTLYTGGTTTIDLNSLKASPNAGIIAKNEMTANQINTNRAAEPEPSRDVTPSAAADYYAPAPVAKASPAKTVPAKSETTKQVAKASSKAAPAKSSASKSTSVAKAPSSTKTATAKKVATAAKKAPDSFWVQAAAYTSKRNADEARSTLESNKIPSEVFTFTDSKGKTFYRVRVGPYVTKSEAEYWQTRIGKIDKFASAKSVIVNTAIN